MDYAAATPLDPAVLEAMQPYFSDKFYNPSALYGAGVAVHKDLEAARARVAHWLGARPSEIVFTAGATESTNMAIHGVMQQFAGNDSQRGNIVVSAVEHPAVLEPALRYDCRIVPVNEQGVIDLAALEAAIDEHTVLVSVMYANNEVGTIQPLREVATVINKKRAQRAINGNKQLANWNLEPGQTAEPYPLYFHTDAAQAGNYLDLHVDRLGVDMLTLNGSKLYGPKQSGVLYIAGHVRLLPLIAGGGQERNARSGTENAAGCIGFATALELAQSSRHEEIKRLQGLQQDFIKQVRLKIPTAEVNGTMKTRLPNNVHITIPGQDNERLLFGLDEAGILAAAGSACSASDDTPSHVLKAIGLSDEAARASLRFSFGRQTSASDVVTVVSTLTKLLA